MVDETIHLYIATNTEDTGMTNNVEKEYCTLQYCNYDWMFHQDTGSPPRGLLRVLLPLMIMDQLT